MTLEEFIEQYDREGSVVLLEGKRDVLPEDRPKLETLGRMLAERTKHIRFRSGNAAGADECFSRGVAEVNPNRLEVITPYAGHRQEPGLAGYTIPLDEVDLVNEPEVIYQTANNRRNEQLVRRYVDGNRDRNTIKAAYLLRDTIKVTGTGSGIPPASFGIFYDDLSNPGQGGTGHTMDVCRNKNVPLIDQLVWFHWLS